MNTALSVTYKLPKFTACGDVAGLVLCKNEVVIMFPVVNRGQNDLMPLYTYRTDLPFIQYLRDQRIVSFHL